jgi:hypothetical protein
MNHQIFQMETRSKVIKKSFPFPTYHHCKKYPQLTLTNYYFISVQKAKLFYTEPGPGPLEAASKLVFIFNFVLNTVGPEHIVLAF